MNKGKINSIRFYQLFFIGALITVGFLLLAANQASATCICNVTAPFDHSAVTYQDYCENICSNLGGVKTWSPPRSGTCTFDSDCGLRETCTADGCMPRSGTCSSDADCSLGETCTADGCMPSGGSGGTSVTDACGGVCSSNQLCNEASGICESLGGACGGSCPEGQVCDLSIDTCVSPEGGATGVGSPQLPGTGATGVGSPSGQGSVQLPNFIGVTSISGLILKITDFLITLAIPFAVLMLVWAGFLFATAQGSEEKLKVAKRNLVWTVAGIAVILASQAIISYITEILGGTGSGAGSALITKIKGTLNQIIGLLFVLVTVYFFWGVITYVRAAGDEKAIVTGKQHMVWGIIGMTVMAGAWGIVEMIRAFVM